MMSVTPSFQRLHALAGKPTVRAVQPIASWAANLPAGYAYNDATDAIENSGGTVLTDLSGYWTYDTINVVPDSDGQELLRLMAAGLVAQGSRAVYVLAADAETLRDAWRVVIATHTYRVASVTDDPAGAAQWAKVLLDRML